jgi:hypothetical protein
MVSENLETKRLNVENKKPMQKRAQNHRHNHFSNRPFLKKKKGRKCKDIRSTIIFLITYE